MMMGFDIKADIRRQAAAAAAKAKAASKKRTLKRPVGPAVPPGQGMARTLPPPRGAPSIASIQVGPPAGLPIARAKPTIPPIRRPSVTPIAVPRPAPTPVVSLPPVVAFRTQPQQANVAAVAGIAARVAARVVAPVVAGAARKVVMKTVVPAMKLAGSKFGLAGAVVGSIAADILTRGADPDQVIAPGAAPAGPGPRVDPRSLPWQQQTIRSGGGGMTMMPFGGDAPPAALVAYTWQTYAGGPVFYRLIDGRIAVQKKNGVWKVYRPKKSIVVSSNPRVGTLLRADRRIHTLLRGIDVAKRRRTPHAKRAGTRK